MKIKTIKLLLLFLAMGLFVSSKEKAQKNCAARCLKYAEAIQTADNENAGVNSYPITLAPGNFIFHL